MFVWIFLLGGAVILGLMVLLWLLSLPLKDASVVDIFWGLGFVVSAWLFFFFTSDGLVERKWLIVALVTIWGLRLAAHIGRRNIGRGEDFRYKQWRKESGNAWWYRSFFKVFLLQGALMWIIGLPLLAAQYYPTASLRWPDWLAIPIWLLGFVFEAVGDRQLVQFKSKSDNKGKLMKSGLWSVSRHPNYFGDATQWWAYYLFALATGAWWAIVSPLIMSVLLRYISGVDMLEKTLSKTKPGFAHYMATTNAFIPWFSRKK